MRFIDLCSGIGGGRLGMEANGFRCVAHAEIDPIPEETYTLFFGEEKNYGDVMSINVKTLPDFEFLIAGFPCQSFSIVGQRKGFEDERGQVIFGIEKILRECDVKYFILENVKGLVNHEGGKTYRFIIGMLENAGYDVYSKVISSTECGVPQIRERVYFVGIKKGLSKKRFSFPRPVPVMPIKEYLIDEDSDILDVNNPTFQRYIHNKYNEGKVNIEEILSHDYWVVDTRQSDLRVQKEYCPTIRKGRQGLLYVKDGKLRVLSGLESILLQGFPMELALKAKGQIAESKLKAQAGNAMTVNVIDRIVKSILEVI